MTTKRDPVTPRDPSVYRSPRDPVTHPLKGVTRGTHPKTAATVTPRRGPLPAPLRAGSTARRWGGLREPHGVTTTGRGLCLVAVESDPVEQQAVSSGSLTCG